MAGPEKKYGDLLNGRDVNRWYEELSRSSRITADTYLRRVGSFCNSVGISPLNLLDLDDKALTDLISDEVTSMEKRGLAGSYISSTVKAVKSWLTHNERKLTRKIRIKDPDGSPTLKNERIPTIEELKKIFASGDPRARAACALMSQSGLRPEVIGSYLGDDGLKISDIPELKVSGFSVEFEKIPAMIVIRPELSKARHQYVTFLGNEGCFYLKSYLEKRLNEGEKLVPGSPLVVPAKFSLRSETSFIRTINIGDIIRQAIRKASFSWRPYVLRAYFDTQLLMAESKGLITRDYRSFFMGHKGDIEHRYTVNKHILNEDLLEDMRSAYSRSLKFLETEAKGISEEDHIRQLREHSIRTYIAITGGDLKEEEKERLLSLEESEFWKEISELFKTNRADALNNGNKHKTISERELETYLNKGWELVQIYPRGDKAVVKLP